MNRQREKRISVDENNDSKTLNVLERSLNFVIERIADIFERVENKELLQYEEVIKYFVKNKPDDNRIKKGILVKEDKAGAIVLTQAFLAEDNSLVCEPNGHAYGRKVKASGMDDELLNLFKGNNYIIIK